MHDLMSWAGAIKLVRYAGGLHNGRTMWLRPIIRKVLGPQMHRRLLRLRRRACETAGVYRYSQAGYWQELRQALPQKNGGTFLEAGAHDGWTGSNTYSLERIWGWRGALVEPVPALFQECRINRPACHVVHAALAPMNFPEPDIEIQLGDLVSTVSASDLLETSRLVSEAYYGRGFTGKVRVPARTLDSIITEAGLAPLDFLSLDVEGFEAEALAGLDFERRAPRMILVEANFPERIAAALAGRYEHVASFGKCDQLWRCR